MHDLAGSDTDKVALDQRQVAFGDPGERVETLNMLLDVLLKRWIVNDVRDQPIQGGFLVDR